MPLIVPPRLQPGDTIAFVAPAGALDETRMTLAMQRLEARGYKVIVPDDLYRKRGYLAGSDERRAEELMAAFTDPQINAIFPGTGNYGATRILDHLNYETIRQNPKVLVGFSDITALHLAINKKSRVVTYHTPNPMYGLGSKSNLSGFSAQYFWSCLEGTDDQEIIEYQPPVESRPFRTLASGSASGELVGGNLSLIIALMGTPYEIDCKGKILFLEDVGEASYRIDRYLSQLRLAGKLGDAAGILVGQFTKCDTDDPEHNLTLEQVFEDYFAELDIPVIANFPTGHAPNNATLPIGGLMEMQSDPPRVRLLHGPM